MRTGGHACPRTLQQHRSCSCRKDRHHAAWGAYAAGRQCHKQTAHDALRSQHSQSSYTRPPLLLLLAKCPLPLASPRLCSKRGQRRSCTLPWQPAAYARRARGGARAGRGPRHRRCAHAQCHAAAAAPAPWRGPRPGGAARGAARRPGPPGTAPAPACARCPAARGGIFAPHAPHAPNAHKWGKIAPFRQAQLQHQRARAALSCAAGARAWGHPAGATPDVIRHAGLTRACCEECRAGAASQQWRLYNTRLLTAVSVREPAPASSLTTVHLALSDCSTTCMHARKQQRPRGALVCLA
jgi:hypothetical protein